MKSNFDVGKFYNNILLGSSSLNEEIPGVVKLMFEETINPSKNSERFLTQVLDCLVVATKMRKMIHSMLIGTCKFFHHFKRSYVTLINRGGEIDADNLFRIFVELVNGLGNEDRDILFLNHRDIGESLIDIWIYKRMEKEIKKEFTEKRMKHFTTFTKFFKFIELDMNPFKKQNIKGINEFIFYVSFHLLKSANLQVRDYGLYWIHYLTTEQSEYALLECPNLQPKFKEESEKFKLLEFLFEHSTIVMETEGSVFTPIESLQICFSLMSVLLRRNSKTLSTKSVSGFLNNTILPLAKGDFAIFKYIMANLARFVVDILYELLNPMSSDPLKFQELLEYVPYKSIYDGLMNMCDIFQRGIYSGGFGSDANHLIFKMIHSIVRFDPNKEKTLISLIEPEDVGEFSMLGCCFNMSYKDAAARISNETVDRHFATNMTVIVSCLCSLIRIACEHATVETREKYEHFLNHQNVVEKAVSWIAMDPINEEVLDQGEGIFPLLDLVLHLLWNPVLRCCALPLVKMSHQYAEFLEELSLIDVSTAGMILDTLRGEKCWSCRGLKAKKPFSRCSRCKLAVYCSRKCQIKDWANHKIECSNFKNAIKKK